jgi:hypothetical protein
MAISIVGVDLSRSIFQSPVSSTSGVSGASGSSGCSSISIPGIPLSSNNFSSGIGKLTI